MAELIERHIDFVDIDRPTFTDIFCPHFVCRDDNALPIITGSGTLPLFSPTALFCRGEDLNRDYNLVFRVPKS